MKASKEQNVSSPVSRTWKKIPVTRTEAEAWFAKIKMVNGFEPTSKPNPEAMKTIATWGEGEFAI